MGTQVSRHNSDEVRQSGSSGCSRTLLTGLRFGFCCGCLLARLALLALLGGPLGLLPGSPLCLQLCFALGWFVSRGRRFRDRHGSEDRHCWGSWERRSRQVSAETGQWIAHIDRLLRVIAAIWGNSEVKELLLQAEDKTRPQFFSPLLQKY